MKHRLQDGEVQLLQNIAFSLVEEVDIFYAQRAAGFIREGSNDEIRMEIEEVKERMIRSVEVLENMRQGTESYTRALHTLYVLCMGKYASADEGVSSVAERRQKACETLNGITSIGFLCHNLSAKLAQLPLAVASGADEAMGLQVTLEQEIRMLLNVLINMVLSVRDDEQLVRDFLDPANGIEEMCFRSIKFSLEIAVVPIRKFLIIFYVFLRLLFGPTSPTKKEWKDLKFNKELLLLLVEKGESPRFHLKGAETDAVELFYKRHMSSDNPIPQIIVVGILRVLLTTCPNAARNSGKTLFK